MTNQKLLQNTRQFRQTPKGVLTNTYQHQKERCKKYGYELGYSLQDLHNFFLEDKKFLKLHKNWVKNGHKYYEKPSIDRIDPNKGYITSNIQVMSWRENRMKGNIEVAKKKWKPVTMYDMNGKELKKYPSIKAAVQDTGLLQSEITMVCQGKRKYTRGYKFVYSSPELLTKE